MKSRKKLSLTIIYIIVLIACILLVYVVPSVLKLFDRTYVAEHGTISVSDKAHAYIVRDDTVFLSDTTGEINRLCKEGDLVKGNSRIVEFSGEGREISLPREQDLIEEIGKKARISKDGVSDVPGYVSYVIDGQEKRFSVSNLNRLTREKVEDQGHIRMKKVIDGKCTEGEPIFKITRNGVWYLLFWVETDRAGRYDEGNDVRIRIEDNDIYGSVSKVKMTKDCARIEIRCNMLVKELLGKRECDIEVRTDSAEGALLNTDSMFMIDGQLGVLVKDKLGRNHFTPVRVKANNGTEAAVFEDTYMNDSMEFVETVKTYDIIVKHPSPGEIKEATGKLPDSEEDYEE